MATTLIIKNANFSVNKVDTVVFSNIPCTGVALSTSAISLTAIGGTNTLAATLTPSDTTDVLRWSSSDPSVASVVDGVVTAVGIGSATITATCGSATASCAVTVAVAFVPHWTAGVQVLSTETPTRELRYVTQQALSTAIGSGSLSGVYPYNGTEDPAVYPYPIPGRVTKIRVQASGYYIGIAWSNLSQSEYNNKAVGLGGNGASSSVGIADDHTYTVPDGIDSFGLTIRRKDNTAATMTDAENVTVTFLTE